MQHRDYKLNLLRHTLREILDLLVPPILDFETLEPLLKAYHSLVARQTFELREEEGLVAHLHLAVESTLLGEIADAEDILLGYRLAVEEDATAVGQGDSVDGADKGGFASSIRAEQSVDRSARYLDRHIIESYVIHKSFRDMFGGDDIAHYANFFAVYTANVQKNIYICVMEWDCVLAEVIKRQYKTTKI